MNKRKIGYTLAPLALLVLAACGGSSDGGSAQYSPLAITESNAKSVSQEVLISSQNIDVEGGGAIYPSATLYSNSAPVQKVLTLARDEAYGVAKLSQTEQCEGGGSITVTGYSAETVSFTANNCSFSETGSSQPISIRIDGKATLTQQTPSGFPPRQDFPTAGYWDSLALSFGQMEQWQCAFDSFVIQISGSDNVSLTYDGNMLVKIGTNDMDNLVYSALNSSRFSMDTPDGSFSLGDASFEALSHTENNGFEFAEVIYNTTYGSGSLGGVGGRVTVTTLENLVYDEGTTEPWESGKLKLVGADNSSVMITIPGQVSDVQLDIDSDGDGVTDLTQDLSWAELESE